MSSVSRWFTGSTEYWDPVRRGFWVDEPTGVLPNRTLLNGTSEGKSEIITSGGELKTDKGTESPHGTLIIYRDVGPGRTPISQLIIHDLHPSLSL